MDHGRAMVPATRELALDDRRESRPSRVRRRRFAPCSGTGAPLELSRASAMRSPISPVLSVARSRRRRSSSATSAAMKIVTLPATPSCTFNAPSSSSSSTQTHSSSRDALHLGAQRAVPATGDVRNLLQELPCLDAARELLVAKEPVVVPVDLTGPLRTRRGRDGDLEPGRARASPLISVPFPRPTAR